MISAFLLLLSSLALQSPSAVPPVPALPDPSTDPLAIQVMLDRAGFSPGVIDGKMGANTEKAKAAYEKAQRTGDVPVETLARYQITAQDTAGPFIPVPEDLMQQAALPSLGYASAIELLAERFHATPGLLQRLNPGARFTAGEEISVPNVDPMTLPPPKSDAPAPAASEPTGATPAGAKPADTKPADTKAAVTVTVSKSTSALTVTDSEGAVVMFAPVTTGSEKDPLPIGEWKVNGVQLNPVFHYNPGLFWDANPAHAKAKIPPGPNNPVGVVWVDISKEHYGLHGTPEPANVGHTASHGCVRLTNWDALRLASLVAPGTRVVFTP